MKAAEGVTEGMKQHDQIAWVGAMNSIRTRAEEIVKSEMTYNWYHGRICAQIRTSPAL